MNDDNLVLVCLIAFAAVFSLLAALAVIMRGLIAMFPVPKTASDTTVTGVINRAVGDVIPGARVTRIEETTPGKKP